MARINGQQIPKEERVQAHFIAPKGYGLIDLDFTALEPKIAATFSRDPTLLELYASGKPHDVYLFVAARIANNPELAKVYQLDNPTVESVAAAKAQFKAIRSAYKEVHLAKGYGGGAYTIWMNLRKAGIELSLEEVKRMCRDYDQLFSGMRDWEHRLKREREDRGGWILNGRGRPMSICDDKLKDIVNTFCQSTGHDCLLTFIYYINQLRLKHGVVMHPWMVNFHDQTTWAYRLDQEDLARRVFVAALKTLQSELKSDILLTGGIEIGDNLWTFKK